ncbi:MAG TPA: hypothetical protein VM261_06515 [Kofleriaceae bacterium]|nr:hypothetical protein [Kofleriaceae bacterium]
MRRALVLVILLGSDACGDEPAAATLPTVDCAAPVPTFAQVSAFRTSCTNCHSIQLPPDDRGGAPPGLNYDVYASAAAAAEDTARTVFTGTMPPSGGLFPADKDVLYRWSLCGSPP